MVSQIDIDELFRKFAILDEELRQLRKEVGEIKDIVKPKNCWVPESKEHVHVGMSDNSAVVECTDNFPGPPRPFIKLVDSINFDEDLK